MKYLDVVSAEHELADDDAADAAGGADDEHGGVLRAGHGELAHGPAAEEDGGVLLGHGGGGGAGHLAEPRELAPHLVEHLPGAPAEPHRVHDHVVQRYHPPAAATVCRLLGGSTVLGLRGLVGGEQRRGLGLGRLPGPAVPGPPRLRRRGLLVQRGGHRHQPGVGDEAAGIAPPAVAAREAEEG